MKRKLRSLSTILLLLILSFQGLSHASTESAQIILYSGKVFLLDSSGNQVDAFVGQSFNTNQYPKVALTHASKLFIQKGERLYKINKPGIHSISSLRKVDSSLYANALSFLRKLKEPRSYTAQSLVRGEAIENSQLKEPDYFERLWQRTVQEPSAKPSEIAIVDFLALAAWYEQQENAQRVAYALERLVSIPKAQKNKFYQRLRGQALQRTSLANINAEVAITKTALASAMPEAKYKALLIGVDQYDDPSWQKLENPINDIEGIKKLLLRDYPFKPKEITLLKNPTFEEIITTFNKLKKTVDSKTHLLIYYAGHGYYPPDEEEGYWIPRDAGTPETQKLFLSTSIVLSKIKAIPSQHTLLIADSCFSGSMIRKTRGHIAGSKYYQELSIKKSRQIITSGGLEPVTDQGGGNHSIFAKNFISILEAKRGEPLSASELALNLRKSVKNAGVDQTPEYGRLQIADDENGEFFFVRKDLKSSQDSGYFGAEAIRPMPQLSNNNQQPETTEKEEKDKEENPISIISDAYKKLTKLDWTKNKNYQVEGNQAWTGVGVMMVSMTIDFDQKGYHYSHNRYTQYSTATRYDISGFGIMAEHKMTNNRWGKAVNFGVGALKSDGQCENSNEDAFISSSCNGSEKSYSIKGNFIALGATFDYTLFTASNFSFQIGQNIRLQFFSFDDFLDSSQETISTIGTNTQIAGVYSKSNWYVGAQVDLWGKHLPIAGTLIKGKSESFKDVKIKDIQTVQVTGGMRF